MLFNQCLRTERSTRTCIIIIIIIIVIIIIAHHMSAAVCDGPDNYVRYMAGCMVFITPNMLFITSAMQGA